MPSIGASSPNDTSTDNKETSFRHRRASTIEENSVSDDLSVSMQSANAPGAIALGGSNQAERDAESQVSITEPTFSLRASSTDRLAPNAILVNDDDIEAEYRDRVRDQIRNELRDEIRDEIVRAVPRAEAVISEGNKDSERQLSKSSHFYSVWKMRKACVAAVFLVVATIIAASLAVFLTYQNAHSETSKEKQSTQGKSLQPKEELSPCQQKCQGLTGLPVIANGEDFKKLVLQYLREPKSSPHGPSINCWDVSEVTDTSYIFRSTPASHTYYDNELDNVLFQSFNESLDCWDVSKVTDMKHMFAHAYNFDQDLYSWDVSKVTDMSFMFNGAINFDNNISSWNVSQVTSTKFMFFGASSFNQDIRSWNVSKVKDMSRMFSFATSFNQDISTWNVYRVRDMRWMFDGASSFDQDLCTWGLKVNTEEAALGWMFNDSGCDIPTEWCHVCPAL